MKNKILIILLMLSTSTIVIAGITTTKVAQKIEIARDNTPYDGKRNFLGDDAHKYIGQTLYLKGISERLREYGYSNFYSNYKEQLTYKPIASYSSSSKYNELSEKEFKVLDVIKNPNNEEYDKTWGTIYYLKLKETTSGDILYYRYASNTEASFPFIVMKFYETQKENAIGKQFVFQDNILKEDTDFRTGKPVTVISGQKWKCLDMTIDSKNNLLSLVLQNDLGEKILVYYGFAFNEEVMGRVYPLDKFNYYLKKLGKEKMNILLRGKIQLGMTKEEVLLSWQKPNKINEDISKGYKREQWVYDRQYIYFVNNKLTHIQNH
ncbi:DUF2845 domain-containing protein [bacterium]|nr:DUF2845 domain-containing protein [bacterium]